MSMVLHNHATVYLLKLFTDIKECYILSLSCSVVSACSKAAEDHWECDGHRRLGSCW